MHQIKVFSLYLATLILEIVNNFLNTLFLKLKATFIPNKFTEKAEQVEQSLNA